MVRQPPASGRWLLVGAVLVTILAVSVARPPDTQRLATGPFGVVSLSLWLHAVGYAGLALALVAALRAVPRPEWQILAGVVVATVAYGVGIELLQRRVPYRTFAIGDALVNAAGAVVAVTVWALVRRLSTPD